ncbi:MAG: HEAT repeat domain-containing protein [Planctomycetes bacterium]|nr:HEAT repeat domain-containing protein [Planctomycetota bacterium]
MGRAFRIECRYCNNPITVEEQHAGKRIKCPKCQNALTVPVPGGTGGDPEKPGQRAGPGGSAGTKDVGHRPVAIRHTGLLVGRLVKLAILVALAAGGWYAWSYFSAQKEKPVPELFDEFADNEATRELTRQILLDKAGPDDLKTAQGYVKHSDPAVRALAAEVLGKTGKSAAHGTLATMAKSDKDVSVRRAACRGLGGIRLVESVDTLVEVLEKEGEDKQVLGDAKGALKELTGERFVEFSEWVEWWKLTKKDFSMKDPAK